MGPKLSFEQRPFRLRNGKPILVLLAAIALPAVIAVAQPTTSPSPRAKIVLWDVPAFDALPDDEAGRLARYGRSIIEATYAHVGPAANDPADRFAGNNLACAIAIFRPA